ncbi:MAG: 50S ribosomal protein L23, partial [Elusimicrobiota bacterium]
ELFKVSVTQVRTMNVRGKFRRFGRGGGFRPDWKKAVVTLKAGDSIELIEQGA